MVKDLSTSLREGSLQARNADASITRRRVRANLHRRRGYAADGAGAAGAVVRGRVEVVRIPPRVQALGNEVAVSLGELVVGTFGGPIGGGQASRGQHHGRLATGNTDAFELQFLCLGTVEDRLDLQQVRHAGVEAAGNLVEQEPVPSLPAIAFEPVRALLLSALVSHGNAVDQHSETTGISRGLAEQKDRRGLHFQPQRLHRL